MLVSSDLWAPIKPERKLHQRKARQRITQLIIGDGQELSDGDAYMPYGELTSSQVLISRFHRPAGRRCSKISNSSEKSGSIFQASRIVAS
jgi:hypothetical protein